MTEWCITYIHTLWHLYSAFSKGYKALYTKPESNRFENRASIDAIEPRCRFGEAGASKRCIKIIIIKIKNKKKKKKNYPPQSSLKLPLPIIIFFSQFRDRIDVLCTEAFQTFPDRKRCIRNRQIGNLLARFLFQISVFAIVHYRYHATCDRNRGGIFVISVTNLSQNKR